MSFARDRVQQLLVPSSSPTLFLLKFLTVVSQDRVQQRLLDLITWMSTCPTRPSGCCSVPPPRTGPCTGTDAPMRLPGSHLRASMSSGLVRGPRGEESGTGTRVPVPVHMTSLLCLLSEALRGEGLGIPSPLPGCHFWRRVLDSVGWFYSDTVHASVVGGYWLLFHTLECEGGPRILRSILRQTLAFLRVPRIRQSLVRCCRVRSVRNSGFTGR